MCERRKSNVYVMQISSERELESSYVIVVGGLRNARDV